MTRAERAGAIVGLLVGLLVGGSFGEARWWLGLVGALVGGPVGALVGRWLARQVRQLRGRRGLPSGDGGRSRPEGRSR